MRINVNLPHDYNFGDPLSWPESIKGPAYYNKLSVDYSPRDGRPFLNACLHRDCPAETCIQ